MIRTRFAHAPGAALHLAGARHAIVAWGFARAVGGQFLVRLDDLGTEDDGAALLEDLAWLGLDWDGVLRASAHAARHAAAAEALKAQGRLYPCFESPKELEARRDRRVRRGQPGTYDRAMLKLTPDQRARAEAGGKRPYFRFRLSEAEIAWDDLTLGPHREKLPTLSDPVLERADGTLAPVLTAAVDDDADGITHLVRGAEQAAGTAVQIDIAAALGIAMPALAHLPPLVQQGRRPEGLAIRQLRADGMHPAALRDHLAALGAGAPFDLASHGPARFELAALLADSRAALATLPFEAAAPHLPPGATPAFWAAVRGHVDLLSEAASWWQVATGEIPPTEPLPEAAATLPPEPWDGGTWRAWLAASGLPEPALRAALTGEETGPPLDALLPLIGRARALARLGVPA